RALEARAAGEAAQGDNVTLEASGVTRYGFTPYVAGAREPGDQHHGPPTAGHVDTKHRGLVSRGGGLGGGGGRQRRGEGGCGRDGEPRGHGGGTRERMVVHGSPPWLRVVPIQRREENAGCRIGSSGPPA